MDHFRCTEMEQKRKLVHTLGDLERGNIEKRGHEVLHLRIYVLVWFMCTCAAAAIIMMMSDSVVFSVFLRCAKGYQIAYLF